MRMNIQVTMNTMGVYNPPVNTFYTQMSLPKYINPAIFIGYHGYYFKHITEHSKSLYIWYDATRNVIEVWGPEWSLQPAMRLLNQRMMKFQDPTSLYNWYLDTRDHTSAMIEFSK
jgi:hypothetical protein